jgi:hypothetical protein
MKYGPSPPHGWDRYPNLHRRPHAPNAGRGRLPKQIARAFMVHGDVVSASDIYRWCERWQQAVADARTFLAVWGKQAEKLSWTPTDLFGLFPIPLKPFELPATLTI